MDVSLFLAKFLGLYILIGSGLHFFRKSLVMNTVDAVYKNPALIVLVGALAIVFGLLIVLTHNVWELSWRGGITLFGYLAIIRGLINFYAPDSGKEFTQKIVHGQGHRYVMAIFALFALYLLYVGFNW